MSFGFSFLNLFQLIIVFNFFFYYLLIYFIFCFDGKVSLIKIIFLSFNGEIFVVSYLDVVIIVYDIWIGEFIGIMVSLEIYDGIIVISVNVVVVMVVGFDQF